MARYLATIDTPMTPEQACAYLSDFANAGEWDPSVVQARRLGDGPPRLGSQFRLVARFLGRSNELTYTITEFDPPHAVSFRAESPTVISLDRISFGAHGGMTRVTYDARLTLRGPLRLIDPLLGLAFGQLARRALVGLRAALGAQAPAGASA